MTGANKTVLIKREYFFTDYEKMMGVEMKDRSMKNKARQVNDRLDGVVDLLR